ncbi:IS30 family transposase [Nocardia brasiliensis]|uniref:IS30 family transposase n=2 Tax=Nocardia brasiliensis TaxID=37326 RepID=UPI0024589193|nr:IS30 family transposase [Nocardia brasiliensis]
MVHWPLKSVMRRFWDLVGAGVSVTAAGAQCGVSENQARRWVAASGGLRPEFAVPGPRRRPRLSVVEREEIAVGIAVGESINSMARRLGRAPSTVMREIEKNGRDSGSIGRYRRRYRIGAGQRGNEAVVRYRASLAQQRSEHRARRARGGKLAGDPVLQELVQDRLSLEHSPEQISGWLAVTYSHRPEMQVSHETIYKALYVQGRGELRRELTTCLRTGRALRKPRRTSQTGSPRTHFADMVNISQRPAEARDRAVPGHWEGDLIIGKDQGSQIGTLVERATGFLMLLHLPHDRSAATVAEAMIATMRQLPAHLRRSLTWDQGSEMAAHARITLATDLEIYFCDPHSPWQRGSNENTNGLLRQYFPKGTDLSIFPADYLDYIATKLNTRPRKRHNFRTPAEVLDQLLSNPDNPVASTP